MTLSASSNLGMAQFDASSTHKKLSRIENLPSRLQDHLLSYLDIASLQNATLVSKKMKTTVVKAVAAYEKSLIQRLINTGLCFTSVFSFEEDSKDLNKIIENSLKWSIKKMCSTIHDSWVKISQDIVPESFVSLLDLKKSMLNTEKLLAKDGKLPFTKAYKLDLVHIEKAHQILISCLKDITDPRKKPREKSSFFIKNIVELIMIEGAIEAVMDNPQFMRADVKDPMLADICGALININKIDRAVEVMGLIENESMRQQVFDSLAREANTSKTLGAIWNNEELLNRFKNINKYPYVWRTDGLDKALKELKSDYFPKSVASTSSTNKPKIMDPSVQSVLDAEALLAGRIKNEKVESVLIIKRD